MELNRRFTQNRPNVLAAEEQYRQLLSERARFNRRIEALPDTQQQLVSLRRDVEVASGMYELLLYKAMVLEEGGVERAVERGDFLLAADLQHQLDGLTRGYGHWDAIAAQVAVGLWSLVHQRMPSVAR